MTLASIILETLEPDSLLRRALEKWGHAAQAEQTIEECAELIVALRHWSRSKATAFELRDEIADVLVMALQMAIAAGEAEMCTHLQHKLERLANRVGPKEMT